MNLGPERANGPVGCGHGHAPSIAPSEHKLTVRRCTATGHYSLPRSPIHIQIHIYTLILFTPLRSSSSILSLRHGTEMDNEHVPCVRSLARGTCTAFEPTVTQRR